MRNVLILGAAGRDFHNFNVFYRNNPRYNVVAFTATQIPGIASRTYPRKLAGKRYPKGIPVFPESELPQLIQKFKVDDVIFAYSDVPHEHVMHLASIALSNGASFVLLGPKDTMLKSKKKVIAVTATRTGAGKSPTTRKLVSLLLSAGKKVTVIRHAMPYGDLEKQEVQRFSSIDDLKKQNCTIEEREEYEPLLHLGIPVYAGVDYEKILRRAEKEASIILFDGGNNDQSFIKPDLLICVCDPFRPGHELSYHPGESNFRMADVLLINKVNSALRKDVETILRNARKLNPSATVIEADSRISCLSPQRLKGRKVIVIEDGPTLTHGGMGFGAGKILAEKSGAILVSVEKNCTGDLKKVFKKFPHLKNVLPAMGYSEKELRELQHAINSTNADFVVSATPVDLSLILKVNKPVVHVSYEIAEKGKPDLEDVLKAKRFI
ncbi:MAG: cyclic 2,3-diphosphoglycerate synthase [Candidatus Diapherotrites archaeon]